MSLALATPAAAADANIWGRWANAVVDREYKAEVPFAILVSLPGMLVITPFWLAQEAIDAASSDD